MAKFIYDTLPIRPAEWRVLFGTLGLDLSTAFIEDLRIPVPDSNEFGNTIRRLVDTHRDLLIAPWDQANPHQRYAGIHAFVGYGLDALTERFGERCVRDFLQWILHSWTGRWRSSAVDSFELSGSRDTVLALAAEHWLMPKKQFRSKVRVTGDRWMPTYSKESDLQ